MGADGIITSKDLKSAGSRAEACAHTITISYKICTYKKKTELKNKKVKGKVHVGGRIYLLIFI
jgi:hypothetical protein